MIMFTVTKPRRKLKRVLQAAALVLLLAVAGIYHSLESVEAMSLFASGEAVSGSEEQTTQPEATTEPEATAQSETTAEAEAATNQAEAENAPEDEAASGSENEAEKESFWQPLLRVLFGDKSQVTSY